MTCTILLGEDAAVDPRKYGTIVAPALGLTVAEARMAIRKGRGIFLENIAEDHARRIAAELEKDGIAARVFQREELPVLPAVRKITQAVHGDDTLTLRDAAGGPPEVIPWDAFGIASCGVVARPQYDGLFSGLRFVNMPSILDMDSRDREIVRENLILKISGAEVTDAGDTERLETLFEEIEQKFESKVHVFFDLITEDLGTWFRVPLDELAYAYTSDSVKMGGSWGFHLLAKDLREKSAGALTEMTLKLFAATDIKGLVFPQMEEFARYTAWTALRKTAWTDAGSSSPSPEAPEPSTDADSSSPSSTPEPPSTSS